MPIVATVNAAAAGRNMMTPLTRQASLRQPHFTTILTPGNNNNPPLPLLQPASAETYGSSNMGRLLNRKKEKQMLSLPPPIDNRHYNHGGQNTGDIVKQQ